MLHKNPYLEKPELPHKTVKTGKYFWAANGCKNSEREGVYGSGYGRVS